MIGWDTSTLLIHMPVERPLDYDRRIGRLRWRRALGAARSLSPAGDVPACSILADGRAAVLLRDDRAIPAPVANAPQLFAGRVVPALPLSVANVAPVHTLRELEAAGLPLRAASGGDHCRIPAAGFDVACFQPEDGEILSVFAKRLFAEALQAPFDPCFRALVFDEPAEHERPELVALLPEGARRLCDVGCGSGAAAAAFRLKAPLARVTGIESDPRAAAVARRRLDRVFEGDASLELDRLAREGESFDAFLFADILEHLEDPIRTLAIARKAASPGAVLVASVPNATHLSLARDLLLGRFDPIPAGLTDAGHLRWFDRRFVAEALEEAGWSVARIEGLPGAPPPDPDSLLSHLTEWPGLDRDSLMTYQWIAIASASQV